MLLLRAAALNQSCGSVQHAALSAWRLHQALAGLHQGCLARAAACTPAPDVSLSNAQSYSNSSSSNSSGGVRYDISRLESRGVISMQGDEAVEFLQGMTTNDMRPLEQPGAGPIYSVLLTAKGKYLHDLFAYSLPGDTPHLLLDVDATGVASALQWLGRYKLRRKLQLADASRQYSVWAAYAAPHSGGPTQQLHGGGDGGTALPQVGGPWRQDPRLPSIGLRGVFDAQQLPPPPAAAGGSSSRKQLAAGMSIQPEQQFAQHRWALGVAEGDTEMPTGEVAPLECNLDGLQGISYTKGCYIGQERNSYTHYRGIIRRRAMPLQLLNAALEGDSSLRLPCPLPIVAAPGKPAVGMLTAHDGGSGIGFLKLPAAMAYWDQRAEPPQLALPEGWQHGPVPVAPSRPAWWPQEWGREETLPSTASP